MLSLKFLLILVAAATTVSSLKHELTIYSDRTNSTTSVTFRSKVPELLAQWRSFFSYPYFSERLFCVTGSWTFYTRANYTTTLRSWGGGATPFCTTAEFNFVESLRFLGPSDTSVESISFYDGTMNHPTSGEEVTLLPGMDSIEYMPFVPTALVATGGASWTLYSGGNFTGRATCFEPETDFDSEYLTDGRFYLSVKKGCGNSNSTLEPNFE